LQSVGAPPAALATLAKASEVAARHQEPVTLTLNTEAAEALLAPDQDDDFTFVPDPPASARSAASDLRSALE
jgi:hypothetical protein